MVYFIYLAVGLVFLIFGAELLVRGASSLAKAVGIPPLIIGLTVVAFGTSAPELAVSVKAALAGRADLAIGNVVGSNILNILLILGASALITPLVVSIQLIRVDVPVMIGVSLLAWFFVLDSAIGRGDGVALFICLVIYLAFLAWKSRRGDDAAGQIKSEGLLKPETRSAKGVMINAVLTLVGIALLTLGARWLVAGAGEIARMFHISELIIGLTIVALGTSLPEVATSISASIKKESDIAVGNIVGSNIFNILAVLGLTAMVSRSGIDVPLNAVKFDIPIMLGVAFLCLPIFFSDFKISRFEGFLFLLLYTSYTTFLILKAAQSQLVELFADFITILLIPFVGLVLIVTVLRSIKGFDALLEDISDKVAVAAKNSLPHIRRMVISVIGGTVVLIGILMIFLPGPALIVIPIGLAILGTEFFWAKRLLNKLKGDMKKLIAENEADTESRKEKSE